MENPADMVAAVREVVASHPINWPEPEHVFWVMLAAFGLFLWFDYTGRESERK